MHIKEFLTRCPELSRLCTQNGWIDNDTLEIEIVEQQLGSVTLNVRFEEIIMEGAGCIAGRIPCYGKLQLKLGADGDVREMEIL